MKSKKIVYLFRKRISDKDEKMYLRVN